MLNTLKAYMQTCQACDLCKTRTNVVFGSGDLIKARGGLVLLGEAPGADEDAAGEPFVGDAGKQLDKILSYVGIKREDVYILNAVLCRPPGNRNPSSEEIKACSVRLLMQLSMLEPNMIVAMGKIATQALYGEFSGPLKDWFDKQDIVYDYLDGTAEVIVTYHPAALLRNSNFKRTVIPHWDRVKEWYESKTG